MYFVENILLNPSFLGAILGAVISSLIAIVIYKQGNKTEHRHQKTILINRKRYLFRLFQNDLKRLHKAIKTEELDQSILNHLTRVKQYFILFDDKVLSKKESEHILLWQDLIIEFEYAYLFIGEVDVLKGKMDILFQGMDKHIEILDNHLDKKASR